MSFSESGFDITLAVISRQLQLVKSQIQAAAQLGIQFTQEMMDLFQCTLDGHDITYDELHAMSAELSVALNDDPTGKPQVNINLHHFAHTVSICTLLL